MTDSSTAQATGDEGLTIAQAAEAFMAMEPDEGQTGDETQGDEPTGDEPETEADDEDQSSDEANEQSEEDEEDADAQGQPQKLTFTIEGKPVEVTLEEAQAGYLRTADYTRKTQEVAEQRKSLEAEKTSALAEREQYRAVLGYWEQQLAQPLYDPAETEQLRSIDPAEYAARLAEEQQRQTQLSANKAEQTRIAAQTTQEQAKAHQQAIEEAEKNLLDAVPEWKADRKKFADGLKVMFDYAETHGFTPADILQGADHRALLILKDAAALRALQSKRPAVEQKLAAVKTATPGAAKTLPTKGTEITRAKQRLAKTGNVDDAARIFMLREPPT